MPTGRDPHPGVSQTLRGADSPLSARFRGGVRRSLSVHSWPFSTRSGPGSQALWPKAGVFKNDSSGSCRHGVGVPSGQAERIVFAGCLSAAPTRDCKSKLVAARAENAAETGGSSWTYCASSSPTTSSLPSPSRPRCSVACNVRSCVARLLRHLPPTATPAFRARPNPSLRPSPGCRPRRITRGELSGHAVDGIRGVDPQAAGLAHPGELLAVT